ncbi:MAG: hypothetical protein PVJ53_15490 [Desulfobacterales bacterium]|jgi:hypothetical protein
MISVGGKPWRPADGRYRWGPVRDPHLIFSRDQRSSKVKIDNRFKDVQTKRRAAGDFSDR